MESTRGTTHTAARRDPENHEHMGSFQSSMQRGRSVEAQTTYLQPSIKMTVASNTSHRTIINYTTARKDTQKKEIEQEKPIYNTTLSPFLYKVIRDTIYDIENENFDKENALSPCLFVVTTLESLMKKSYFKNKTDYFFTISRLGPYYEERLDSALEYLKPLFANGCSWEYYRILNTIAEQFHFHPKNSPCIKQHRKTLVVLYKQAVATEMNYVEYIKNHPVLKNSMYSFNVLRNLFSQDGPAHRYKFLTRKDYINYKTYENTQSNFTSHKILTDDQITEQLNYLDSNKLSGAPININNRRVYNYLLNRKLERILEGSLPGDGMNIHDRTCLLKNLTEMCCNYTSHIHDSTKLLRCTKKISQAITTDALLALEGKEDNVDNLKETLLYYTSLLSQKGYLNQACERLLFKYSQPQPVMKTESFSDYQCAQILNKIHKIIKGKSPDKFLTGANMLKQLLDEHEKEIIKMDTAKKLMSNIESTKKIFYIKLFMPIFHTKIKCEKRRLSDYDTVKALSIYKNQFIEANPNTFILMEDKYKTKWHTFGGFIFYDEIHNLHDKMPISEEDTRVLLLLKQIMPELPHMFIKRAVQFALKQCFKSIADGVGYISIETTNELSHWIDSIYTNNPIGNELESINAQWKNQIMNPPTPMPPMELSQLPFVEYCATQISSQNMWHHSHPEFSPPIPPPYQNTPSQQASFMSTAGCSMQEGAMQGAMQGAIPHQYSTINNPESKMNNRSLDEGKKQLFKASELYKTPSNKALHGSAANDTLLTDSSSDYYSLFENGINLLTIWIMQIEGQIIPRDDIYGHLMKLTNEDGHQIISDLFNRILKPINDKDTISYVVHLLHYLFSIRLSMGMGK